MLLERYRKYVTEPLYNGGGSFSSDEYVVLDCSLVESESRIIDVLSVGRSNRLHQFVDSFPWDEMEELLGEHLSHAIQLSKNKTALALAKRMAYLPNIFDKYMFHHRIDYLT